ncbi:sulfatase-like hydrolase/transferase [Polynucleobacter sp. JS-Safj-400b-B2]|uniref:sulfatase-like hydrolase/transferase n=1 Tax=Polynucleobacter sp. JS-Safj-400b-B2 TaxID=2576921 RepID=UPI001C0E65F5|nr:sulfatase-like hydrolase/transferase [Polynucleobacter sp. JS-Safj-400b-B2]MBU3627122.1 sulfatase-like hydrolase/transferase [Polynucleobacter sp. JS-Safj-400b-B2]
MSAQDDSLKNPSRRNLLGSGAALLGSTLLPEAGAASSANSSEKIDPVALPDAPPAGYNILYILVDQEHFFPKWPFPVPAREAIKKKGVTFTNHHTAAVVCSSARSVLYTGHHIQQTGIADNLNYIWQRDLSTKIKTIGHRLTELGYYSAYQGKWHLSANMDLTSNPIDAPLKQYQKTIETYGFQDFFGLGDLIDGTLGGYQFDDTTIAFTDRWFRTKAQELKAKDQPWFLAVNLVNPHDVMYFNSDLPGENIQSKSHSSDIARAPNNDIYNATWDDVPLPSTRSQSFDMPGRPIGQKIYQGVQNELVGYWPDEDRRWRALQNYYFNAIRDCDQRVEAVLDMLKQNGMEKNTIIIFNADHGELGGHHQMRGKGTSIYRQQNHLPLMIVHPAYPGGVECEALTSQLDIVPTIIGLTGKDANLRKKVSEGLKGKDFSTLLKNPSQAKIDAVRPTALFNFDMLSYQDNKWAALTIDTKKYQALAPAQQLAMLTKYPPNFSNRTSIRSIYDGQYRFGRYFAPNNFNTPKTMEALVANNDVEVYDLKNDPEEIHNLALDMKKNGDLIFSLNQKLNEIIANEVGVDDGSYMPIRNGKWYFPPLSER